MQPSASRLTFNPVLPKRVYSIVDFLFESVPGSVTCDEVTSTVVDHGPLRKHAPPSGVIPELAHVTGAFPAG